MLFFWFFLCLWIERSIFKLAREQALRRKEEKGRGGEKEEEGVGE